MQDFVIHGGVKKEILGNLIFSYCAQSDSLYGRGTVENLPLSDNFLDIPLVGVFFGFVLKTCLMNFFNGCLIFCLTNLLSRKQIYQYVIFTNRKC